MYEDFEALRLVPGHYPSLTGGCLLSVGLTRLTAPPRCAVASYRGCSPESQPPTAVTQDISERGLARAKFKNENATPGSILAFANCQVTGFGPEALCRAQGG